MINSVLFAVSVIFALSLIGAYVLFKLLKSTAIVKKAGYQAGGALAGFLIIFGTLFYAYNTSIKAKQETKLDWWTVTGQVKKADSKIHQGIIVQQLRPSTLTGPSGTFRLEPVRVSGNEGLPEIQIEGAGFFPVTIQLNKEVENKKAYVDIDKRRIELKETIELYKME